MKVAVVTGGSSGIGLELVKRLLAHEYAVVGVARDPANIPDGAVKVAGDVAQRETAERTFATARERFGRVDLLVNNAGIFLARPFTEYSADDYTRLVGTNLHGFVYMTQEALRVMVPAGGGHIINIGTSLVVNPIASVPSALPVLIKGGIEAASRSLAIEYAQRGVRVNTVAAGIIDTPMHPRENHDFLRTLNPAGRLGSSQEIADAVLYLERASFVTGEVLHVDGGAHAGKWS